MEDPETFTQQAAKICELAPDGVLIAPWAKREAIKFIQELDRLNIPYVFIDSTLKESHPISFVVHNALQSGCLAAKLLNYGIAPKSNILILHITRDLPYAFHLRQRENGFLNYLESLKQPQHTIIKRAVPAIESEINEMLNDCIKEKRLKVSTIRRSALLPKKIWNITHQYKR